MKTRGYKNKLKLTLLIILNLAIFAYLQANPKILSVTMNPPNPGFGQSFTLTVNFCANIYVPIYLAAAVSTKNTPQNAQLSGTGQIFLVSSAGINVQTQNFASGAQIGYNILPAVGAPGDCTDCAGQTGKTGTFSTVLTMPDAKDFPGCNNTQLYMIVRMGDSNIQEAVWDDPGDSCAPYSNLYISPGWTIPTPSPYFNLHKRAEGVLQSVGDLLLFSIDYEYGNGPLTITDVIPNPPSGQFTLVSVGPSSMWNGSPPIGTTAPPGGTITWTLPDRTGQPGFASGTVWYLLRMTGNITPGTVINNTATGNMPSVGTKSSTTSITVGQAAVTLTKSQEKQYVNYLETVTYYLEYNINGSKLVNYEPFDDKSLGSYVHGTPPPPSGWQYVGTDTGTWTISDPCNTGDYIITGSSPNSNYPSLTVTGPNFCTGTVVTDVLIDASYEGADALVIIRNNMQSGSSACSYALVVSVDNNPGKLAFQKCCSNCSWPASTNAPVILTNTWYRVKVEAVSDCSFRAKIWKKGEPEPSTWDLTWTDGSCVSCSSYPTWVPGIGQQGGATGYVRDSYNNFMVYQPRTSVNTSIYDTIPTGITYINSAGPTAPTQTSPKINWDLGTISNGGGSYTWWGQVTICDPVTNKATIIGTGIAPVDSNEVLTIPVCPTPVINLVKSVTPTTGTIGTSVTFTLQVCNSGAGPDAKNMVIWDTIPVYLNWGGWIGTAGSGSTTPGGLIYWNIGTLTTGNCVTRQWWGIINSIP